VVSTADPYDRNLDFLEIHVALSILHHDTCCTLIVKELINRKQIPEQENRTVHHET
jgi:hypothetical protein